MTLTDPPDDGENTDYKEYGVVPAQMLLEDDFDFPFWVKVDIDPETGQLAIKDLDEDDVEKAEERYVSYLVENDIIDENEASDVLG